MSASTYSTTRSDIEVRHVELNLTDTWLHEPQAVDSENIIQHSVKQLKTGTRFGTVMFVSLNYENFNIRVELNQSMVIKGLITENVDLIPEDIKNELVKDLKLEAKDLINELLKRMGPLVLGRETKIFK